jgi:hypothetical protein
MMSSENRFALFGIMLLSRSKKWSHVMPGLVPGIHVLHDLLQGVDGRGKPGQARP